jgi:hypothetical protein
MADRQDGPQKSRARDWIVGVCSTAILVLLLVGYHQSKACAGVAQFVVFLFAPVPFGFVIGGTLAETDGAKIVASIGCALAAFVIAAFAVFSGWSAGTCGG